MTCSSRKCRCAEPRGPPVEANGGPGEDARALLAYTLSIASRCNKPGRHRPEMSRAGGTGARWEPDSVEVQEAQCETPMSCDRNLRSLSNKYAKLHKNAAPSAYQPSNFLFFRFTRLHYVRAFLLCRYSATPRARESV